MTDGSILEMGARACLCQAESNNASPASDPKTDYDGFGYLKSQMKTRDLQRGTPAKPGRERPQMAGSGRMDRGTMRQNCQESEL